MSEIGKYWTLVRINPAGGYRAEKCAIAHHYIEQNYAEITESTRLQQLLIRDYQNGSTEAELCLRCFISHCTLEEASSIARQFGDYYQFNQFDVLSYVLDDDGMLNRHYHPLSQKILASYNPAIASLNTWATRLVRQHPDLNQFLKQQGLYLKSDWAILNSTTTKRLERILSDRFYWSANAIQTAILYLESYHSVYLSDRISEGSQGRCKEPTSEQLKRIADQLQTKLNQPISPNQVLKQLLAIAQCLRQHRLNRYETESIEDKPIQAEQLTVRSTESDPTEEFLYYYRAQFVQCLTAALETVVHDYTSRLKEQKANQFRIALHLLYCQRITMTQIAEQLDLKRQDNVARLLKLKTLRADVGLHILTRLKQDISAIAQNFTDPERLSQFAETIDEALRDQVDALLEKDAQQSKTPKAYQKDNLFAEQLCALLSRDLP
ncbi:hypothetical protein ACQ4M3_35070 [Leptolyngbya sp. AN03gr2]|uniref:hypothetical protein n=1 Tax=unclassified Leptolyngbya TaxID=2650499 RepID=UPI003D31A3F4